MALNKDDLKNDLVARLITGKKLSKQQKEEMTNLFDQIAEAVTDHIKRGEVTVNHSGTGPETANVE